MPSKDILPSQPGAAGTSGHPSQEQGNQRQPQELGIYLGMGQGQAWMSAHEWESGSGPIRGTGDRHNPTMVGQVCGKRTMACWVMAHSPTQSFVSVVTCTGPCPKWLLMMSWADPVPAFPWLCLVDCPMSAARLRAWLRTPAKTLPNLPIFWCFQGYSTALVALLAASTCHWFILSSGSSQMSSFKRRTSGCKLLPSCKHVTYLH